MNSTGAAALIIVLGASSPALGSGFYIDEQGARATGKAGAFIADASDPSAVYYNPAGIARLEGMQLQLGASHVAPSASFSADGDTAAASFDVPPAIPNGYLTYQPTKGYTAGLGVTAPFGLAIAWPDDFIGRYHVREQQLRTTFISAVVGIDASTQLEGLSVGLGVDLVPASVYLVRDVPLGAGEGTSRLGGSALGVGGRAGLLYRPPSLDGLSLAVAWRSAVALRFEGEADFDVDPGTPRSALPQDGGVTTDLTLPDAYLLGVAYTLGGWLQLELDAHLYRWSRFDELVIELEGGERITTLRRWRDSAVIRAGAEATLGPVVLRGGAAYDQSPVPSRTLEPGLPDAARQLIAGGVGIRLPWDLSVDAGVLYALPSKRESGERNLLRASYEMSAWVASVSVSARFLPDTTAPRTE